MLWTLSTTMYELRLRQCALLCALRVSVAAPAAVPTLADHPSAQSHSQPATPPARCFCGLVHVEAHDRSGWVTAQSLGTRFCRLQPVTVPLGRQTVQSIPFHRRLQSVHSKLVSTGTKEWTAPLCKHRRSRNAATCAMLGQVAWALHSIRANVFSNPLLM